MSEPNPVMRKEIYRPPVSYAYIFATIMHHLRNGTLKAVEPMPDGTIRVSYLATIVSDKPTRTSLLVRPVEDGQERL